MTDRFQELTPIQLDALREIGNIGSGNAATALSQMINKKIDMMVPSINILPFAEVAEIVGGAEILTAGVYLKVSGSAPSSILFILPLDSVYALLEMLTGMQENQPNITDMGRSALMEVGNILAGAYLNSLAMFTNQVFMPSVPSLAIDMAGALLGTVLMELGEVGDTALVIETNFIEENNRVKGFLFLLPEPGCLDQILTALGVNGL